MNCTVRLRFGRRANGEIDFNYLNLEGNFTSSTIGIQSENNSDAIMMSFDSNSLIQNEYSILISQSPDWINISNTQGSVDFGNTSNEVVTLNTESLTEGIYNSFLFIDTNDSDVSIPIELTVGFQIPGDINDDGEINIQDIIIIVTELILNGGYDSVADLNQDNDVNVQDILILLSSILG